MIGKTISVIIPFYNRSNYLSQALYSVLSQDCGNIEIILVDDGSTDGSLEIALEFWENWRGPMNSSASRTLRWIRIDHSGMPGYVRNRGVEIASAPLVAFLDSDDLWLAHKLSAQLRLHPEYPLSHTRELWMRAGSPRSAGSKGESPGTLLFREVLQKNTGYRRSGWLYRDSLEKCVIGPSTAIMDMGLFRELGGFREDLEVAEDYEFWLRVTSRTPVGYIDKPCIQKRAGMPGQYQLSEKYGHIEGFRIAALLEFLDNADWITDGQREQAEAVLVKKAKIFRQGADKRGNDLAVKKMDLIISGSAGKE